jgi:biofilm PGA synthesis protein PgaD
VTSSLIIDHSASRPVWARTLDLALSALMWLLYLYLIQTGFADLIGLVRDTYAWGFSGAERPDLPTLSRFGDTLHAYGVVIMANAAVLVAWALYNRLRFAGEDRRQAVMPVEVADLAALYGLPPERIESWQKARILTMRHAPDGTLTGVIEG